MLWARFRARAKLATWGLVLCAAVMTLLAVTIPFASAQTDPNDALLKALQHPGETGDATTPVKPTVQTYQPATPSQASPPSRLETLYSERAGRPLRQFGYDVLGVPSAVTITQSGAVQDNYVLGPGDELVFVLRGQENATYRERINRDGQVILPKLNPINAVGRSFGDFRRELEARVAQAFISTSVFVSLGEVRQVTVLVAGEVRAPGTRIVSAFASPLDAILLSGGIAKTGSLRNVRLTRGGVVHTIDLYMVLTQAGSRLGLLRDGDRIYVPPLGATVAVTGVVDRPGIYELPGNSMGTAVGALIRLAGGLQIAGGYNLSKTQLGQNGNSQLVPTTTGAMVRSGEIVFVDASHNATLGRVTLAGATMLGGDRPLSENKTVAELIRSANDLTPDAYTASAIIVRRDPVVNAKVIIPFSLVGSLSGRSSVALQANDTVYVFNQSEVRALTAILTKNVNSPYNAGQLESGTNSGAYARQNTGTSNAAPNVPASNNASTAAGGPNGMRLADDANGSGANSTQLAALAQAQALASRDIGAANLAIAPLDEAARNEQVVEGIAAALGVTPTMLERAVGDGLVWMLDAVRAPGPYLAGSGTTLSDMIQAAGGPLQQADLSAIEVTSTAYDQMAGVSRTSRTLYAANEAGSTSVHPLDVIRIRPIFSDREGGTVTVVGQVRYPGVFDITRDERLSSVLRRAGGMTEVAYPYGAIFTRRAAALSEKEGNERAAREIESQLSVLATSSKSEASAGQGLGYLSSVVQELRNTPALGRVMVQSDPAILSARPDLDVVLQPGDSVYIPKRPSSVSVSGEVLNAGSFQYRPNFGYDDYIRMAGGPTQSAYEGLTFVVLPDGSAMPTRSDWLSFRSGTQIPPGSTIVVPRDLRPFDWGQFVKDATQIVSQLAITAASLSIIHSNP